MAAIDDALIRKFVTGLIISACLNYVAIASYDSRVGAKAVESFRLRC